MAKGDQIEIQVRETATFTVEARQNGRTVEYAFENESKVNWLVVTERTRGGTIVHEVRFPVDMVLALARKQKEV